MKSLTALFTVFFLVFIAIMISSCGGRMGDRNSLSPVRAADQATQNLVNNIEAWASDKDLAEMSPEEFLQYIYSVNPSLDWDIIHDLTSHGKIEPGERVSLRYHYFDQEGVCRMEDGEGKFTKVKFKNEIVVEVIRPAKKSLWIAISCLNGMLKIDGSPGISSDASMRFTIEKGQGLSRYLADDYWSVNVAEEFGLLLFKGKEQRPENLISPDQARELIPEVDETQITVFVQEGWTFVLANNNWTLNGLSPERFKEN